LITGGCLAALAGIGLSRKLSVYPNLLWLIFIPLLMLFCRKNIASLITVIIVGLGLGLWRGGMQMQKLHQLQTYTAREVTIQATATNDSVYGERSQIEFTANDVTLLNPATKPLAGSFKISGFGENMIYRGDRVQVSGKLFPTRGANQARIAYAQLNRVGSSNSSINSFTRRFTAGMESALPEPNASFGLGLLIGQRNNLSSDLTNQLIMVGLVHIVAVSGYNLTIIVRVIGRLKLGSKYQRLIASLVLMITFTLVTGFSASIVRAVIVSGLSLWAWYYGRQIRPILLIAFVAALTGFINPFYVWGDLGWYLSFLAFFGVLIIAPIIASKLFRREPKMLSMVVLETLSAEIMTLPLIMLSFGQLSLIGLLANGLVVPFIPLAMLLSAVAAGAGVFIPSVAGWLAWPANILLTYILDVVKVLSEVPGIFVHRSINLFSMLSLYASILLIVIIAYRHRTPKTAIITDVNQVQEAL